MVLQCFAQVIKKRNEMHLISIYTLKRKAIKIKCKRDDTNTKKGFQQNEGGSTIDMTCLEI